MASSGSEKSAQRGGGVPLAAFEEKARVSVPQARIGPLRLVDLLRAHAPEEIIRLVELADMLEAEPAPLRRAVRAVAAMLGRRAELAGIGAAGMRAGMTIALHAAMKARVAAGLSLVSARSCQSFTSS